MLAAAPFLHLFKNAGFLSKFGSFFSLEYYVIDVHISRYEHDQPNQSYPLQFFKFGNIIYQIIVLH